MATHQSTFEVSAAPAVVAAYLADLRNRANWDPTVVSVAPPSGEGAGDAAPSTARVVIGFYGRRIELDCVVEEAPDAPIGSASSGGAAPGGGAPGGGAAPGEPLRVVLRGTGKTLERRDAFTIEPLGEGSRITYRVELTLKGMLRVLDRGLQVSIDGLAPRAVKELEAVLAA